MNFKINREGCTRIVILTDNYAFKLPNFLDGWRLFLKGLLANMNEVIFSQMKLKRLCPVVLHFPLGFLVVMPKVRIMSPEEFKKFDFSSIGINSSEELHKLTISEANIFLDVESKYNSFGWLGNKLVCIDYGN